MPAVSFTRAEVERALEATRIAGISVAEVRIEKTSEQSTIRILCGDVVPSDIGDTSSGPQPDPW